MNALTHPWVGAMLCVELDTSCGGKPPAPFGDAAISMPGIPIRESGWVAGSPVTVTSGPVHTGVNSRHSGGSDRSPYGACNAHVEGPDMTVTRNPSALTLADLNTTINHEPRIKDVRIGERLGMARPTNIRQTIEANMAELGRYGDVASGACNVPMPNGATKTVTEYYLNEPQTLLLCMFSRTDIAADVRQEVISVYMAYRRGTLPQEPAALSFDQQMEQMRQERLLMEKRRLMLKEVRAVSPLDAHRLAQEWGYVTTAPQQADLLPDRRAKLKPGDCALFLEDKTVIFDSSDTDLTNGDMAVVVRNQLRGRQVPFTAPIRLGRNYFGADDVPDLDGVAHLAAEPVRSGRFKMMPEVRILGRVLSVEAL